MPAAASFDRRALFEETPIPRAVLTLSIPTILSSLVSVLYSLADTYFVGMLNNPVQTAAVTLAAPVLLAFNAVNNLFGVGSSSMMSRALGRGDLATLRRSSAFGFWGAVTGGVVFSLLCTVLRSPLLVLLGADASTAVPTNAYLNWTVSLGAVPAILNVVIAYMVRSEGATLHASIGTMSGCLLNILLDPIFILVLGMGAEGAALATFLSNCVAVGYFLLYLLLHRGKTMVCIDPRALHGLNKKTVLGVFGVGVPASIQNLLNVISSTLFNNLAAPYGAAALAAMGICTKVNMVPMYIAMGLSQGIMPLISYTYASNNVKRMKGTFYFAVRISMLFLVAVTVLLFAFPGPVVGMFIKDAETVAYGTRFLRGLCLGIPLLAMDFLAIGVFQSTGQGGYALAFAVLRKVALEIPIMYLLNRLFPLYGLPYAQPLAELTMTVAAVLVLRHLFRRIERDAHTPLPGDM